MRGIYGDANPPAVDPEKVGVDYSRNLIWQSENFTGRAVQVTIAIFYYSTSGIGEEERFLLKKVVSEGKTRIDLDSSKCPKTLQRYPKRPKHETTV